MRRSRVSVLCVGAGIMPAAEQREVLCNNTPQQQPEPMSSSSSPGSEPSSSSSSSSSRGVPVTVPEPSALPSAGQLKEAIKVSVALLLGRVWNAHCPVYTCDTTCTMASALLLTGLKLGLPVLFLLRLRSWTARNGTRRDLCYLYYLLSLSLRYP